jgi:hypothetical protein
MLTGSSETNKFIELVEINAKKMDDHQTRPRTTCLASEVFSTTGLTCLSMRDEQHTASTSTGSMLLHCQPFEIQFQQFSVALGTVGQSAISPLKASGTPCCSEFQYFLPLHNGTVCTLVLLRSTPPVLTQNLSCSISGHLVFDETKVLGTTP